MKKTTLIFIALLLSISCASPTPKDQAPPAPVIVVPSPTPSPSPVASPKINLPLKKGPAPSKSKALKAAAVTVTPLTQCPPLPAISWTWLAYNGLIPPAQAATLVLLEDCYITVRLTNGTNLRLQTGVIASRFNSRIDTLNMINYDPATMTLGFLRAVVNPLKDPSPSPTPASISTPK